MHHVQLGLLTVVYSVRLLFIVGEPVAACLPGALYRIELHAPPFSIVVFDSDAGVPV